MYEKLDWEKFMAFKNGREKGYPKETIPFVLNTPHLQRDFQLDILIWNLTPENLTMTQKAVQYVLNHFNKLFETAWTALYYYLCSIGINSETSRHTLTEFYQQQIDFSGPYYTIQLEINSSHLTEGKARYCFIVSTVCSYQKWMISDDDMRIYMDGNRPYGFDTNNDNQILTENWNLLCGGGAAKDILDKVFRIMKENNFQYAPSFLEADTFH